MTLGHYILDAYGEPVLEPDLLTWARWFEYSDNRRLAWTETKFHNISTVFLGLDHNLWDGGPPLLWETMAFTKERHLSMVFGRERSMPDWLDQDRYETRAEALAGHEAMVAKYRKLEADAEALVTETLG